ncbi:MAG: hypothetical protein GX798_06400 [Bacteroidales bacterium]|nr:hypothetical protein [Bacteroidales bacterium]
MAARVVSAQNITVKGTVADRETGEPIPFASIQVKGTTAGVAADVDGRFVSFPFLGQLAIRLLI